MDSTKPISEYQVVITSFFIDLLDVIFGLTVATITGSVVMLSEAFQGMADLICTSLLLLGYKRSKKKADKLHPFGYGKEVYFWTLISAVVMMTLAATASLYLGLHRLFHPYKITHIEFGYGALLIALVTNGYGLSVSIRRLLEGKPLRTIFQTFSQSEIVATKNAFVLDLLGTMAASCGLVSLLLYQRFGETRFDGVGAIVIGIMTAVFGVILIIGVKSFLVGKRAAPQIEKKIREAALTIPQVKEILDLRTMQIGPNKLLATMDVHIQDDLTTDELERLIDKIKKRVYAQVPSIQHVQVELETPEVS